MWGGLPVPTHSTTGASLCCMTSTDVPTCTPMCPGAESPQVRTAALLWLILLLDLVWPFQAGLTHALGHKPRSGQGIDRLSQTKFQMRQPRGWPGKVWGLHFPHLGPCPARTPKAAMCCPVTPQTGGRGGGQVSRWPQITYSWTHVSNRDVVLVMNFASSWKQLPSPPGWPLLPFSPRAEWFPVAVAAESLGGRVGGYLKGHRALLLQLRAGSLRSRSCRTSPSYRPCRASFLGQLATLGPHHHSGWGGPCITWPLPVSLCPLFSEEHQP